jgi:hypothetical protein
VFRSPAADEATVACHSHCHQRVIGLEVYTVAVLDTLGSGAETSNAK